ncbi:MAG: hypothetical protein HZB86_11960 [Deltaproteobacteria bacterium]|nr:hypothetical protein [Deltaproteobacteria bacterium]
MRQVSEGGPVTGPPIVMFPGAAGLGLGTLTMETLWEAVRVTDPEV